MNSIAQFTGGIINIIYEALPVYGACILTFALMDKLLFLAIGSRFYNTIRYKANIQPLIAEIRKKYANDPGKRMQEFTKLLITNKYPVFGNIGNIITETLFSIGLIGLFSDPGKYLPGAGRPLPFLGFDLSASPWQLFQAADTNSYFFASLFLSAVTLVIMICHDQIMDQYSFVSQSHNKFIWVLFAGAFIFCNQGFTLYWFGIKLMDIVHIFIVMRSADRQFGKK